MEKQTTTICVHEIRIDAFKNAIIQNSVPDDVEIISIAENKTSNVIMDVEVSFNYPVSLFYFGRNYERYLNNCDL